MERENLLDDPFMFALEVNTRGNTPMSATIRSFLHSDVPDMHDLMRNVHERIAASGGSKCIVYRTLNPSLTVHRLYTERHVVNDALGCRSLGSVCQAIVWQLRQGGGIGGGEEGCP